MDAMPVLKGITRLRDDARAVRFAVKCLVCNENTVRVSLKGENEVFFACNNCDSEKAIEEVAAEIAEWVSVLAWVGSYKAIKGDLGEHTK